MQADGRLIQHVGHSHQAGAELRGQADALRFPAGQSEHGPAQSEIIQADVDQEVEAVGQFLEKRLGYHGMTSGKAAFTDPGQRPINGQIAEFLNIHAVHAYIQCLGPQARAVTGGALHRIAVAGKYFPPGVTVLHASFQQIHDARPVFRGNVVFLVEAVFPYGFVVQRCSAHKIAAQAAVAVDAARLAVEKRLEGFF